MHARASDPMWCTLSDDWRPALPRRLENAAAGPSACISDRPTLAVVIQFNDPGHCRILECHCS